MAQGRFPKNILERNLLDYYVDRDIAVIKYLQNKVGFLKNKLVVAGHSEGSTIAIKLLVAGCQGLQRLCLSGGNPLGAHLNYY